MPKIEYKKDTEEIIKENLTKNVDLYNKYTMLLASIFISALTAIGQHNGSFSIWLKISILLFSLSLFSTLAELALLIIHDSIVLNTMECKLFNIIDQKKYSIGSCYLAFFSLVVFLLGIVSVNVFIFTPQG